MNPTEPDHRTVELLEEALKKIRAGQEVDVASWPDEGEASQDLPELLATARALDEAVQTWKTGNTVIIPRDEVTPGEGLAEPKLPERIGRYRILGRLGTGGMGHVYKAEDESLQRLVAIKVPHFLSSQPETIRQRFMREVRTAAGVRHPHVCPIHDVGEEEGSPYTVMAFIDGPNLADLLKNGPVAPVRAVEIVRKVARGLEAVHLAGIIHRDLKPANVLMDYAGEPYLTDFGLARTLLDDPELTQEGTLLGTPAYMAPEQARGERDAIGPWSDVYSLGVILFQMLTGRLPFDGPTTLSLLHQVAHDNPPPPSRFLPGLDTGLERIVQSAMAFRPEERSNARRLAQELEDWTAGIAATVFQERNPAAIPESTVEKPADQAREGKKPQTFTLSGLPEGQTLSLSVDSPTPAKVKFTLTEEEPNKRRKRRRLTISISVTLAGLLALAVALPRFLPDSSPRPTSENNEFALLREKKDKNDEPTFRGFDKNPGLKLSKGFPRAKDINKTKEPSPEPGMIPADDQAPVLPVQGTINQKVFSADLADMSRVNKAFGLYQKANELSSKTSPASPLFLEVESGPNSYFVQGNLTRENRVEASLPVPTGAKGASRATVFINPYGPGNPYGNPYYLPQKPSNANPEFLDTLSGKAPTKLVMKIYQAKGKASRLVFLSGDILKHINVGKTRGNLALFRDEGKLSWPEALKKKLGDKACKELESNTTKLILQASKGAIEAKVLKEVNQETAKMDKVLLDMVNKVPPGQYIQCKRFLKDVREGNLAIESGDVPAVLEFRKFVAPGRTLPEVVNYLAKHNLQIVGALPGDESAYLALYNALKGYEANLSGPDKLKK